MLTLTHAMFSIAVTTGSVVILARVILARVADTRTRSLFTRVYRGGAR